MRVIRAHDGVAFDFTQQHLDTIDCLSAFFQLIAATIQIDPSQIILMNPLGSQLTQNLLNSIIHQPNQTTTQNENLNENLNENENENFNENQNQNDTLLYAFDRQFLSADPSEALTALSCQPEHLLQPKPSPFNPNNTTHLQPDQLEQLSLNYHHIATDHLRTSLLLLTHVRAQKSALQVALNNLDKCREPPQGALEAYETFAQPLVQDYGQLLQAFAPSFALAKRVKIHPALLPTNTLIKSNSTPTASHSGNNNTTTTGMMKVKYMGDYVMEDKILQIRDKCLKVYEDFRNRFEMIRARSTEVNEGAAKLREELSGGDCDLDDLYELEKDADEGFRRIEELTAQIGQMTREGDSIECLIESFTELIVLDEDSRERIGCLIERKNFWLHYLAAGLNQISRLQSIIPSIGIELQALNTDLKTRTDPFRYLARLKDFVTAYASTVVEVVRRREYARHLADYASALNNLISKLANDERRRRGVYHSEYAGRLPFAVDGLDDKSVPTIEFEIRYIGGGGAIVPKSKDTSKPASITGADLPPLTRADVDELLAGLQNIEESPEKDEYSPQVPAREVRLLVEKQFSRLEAMENAFALAVEKFVMSESESCIAGQPADAEEVSQLKARVAELEAAQENLTERLRAESTAAITASRKAQQETQIHIRKVEDLKLQLLSVKEEARHEKERLTQDQQPLITELANAGGTIARLNERIGQLEDELKARTKSLQDTERQVTSARVTADDATRELHDLEARHRDHVSDHEIVLNRLQQSRDRCTELERGLTECQSRNQVLSSQVEEQTELVANRASEAQELRERLEKEISELKARLEDEKQQNCNLQNKVTQQEIEIGHITQQSKLHAEAHTAAEARWKEETMTSTSCLENHCLKAVQALKSYQEVHRTVKNKIANMPRPGSSQKTAPMTSSSTAPAQAQQQTGGEATSSDHSAGVDSGSNGAKEGEELPSPLSPEFEALLQSLLQFDPDSMVDVVQQKLDQLSGSIRKWMKDCKGYRERASRSQEQAQVKITFRDFAKGDLALFLPTRNPSAQVWAAFNVSFPHYFLKTNETVAPIIKSREWLVARIVSLTEKMVDPKDPETNPYQLPAGTRYFLLEVEPWSVEKTSRRMAHSMIGADSPARPKMQSQMRSTTLPSQTAAQASPPSITKRPSFAIEAVNSNSNNTTSSGARVEEAKTGALETTKPYSGLTESPLNNTQANNYTSDLNQSEYTVIDHAPTPAPPEASSDSPFRTSLSSSILSHTRGGPSGLSLSLKTYHRSPLGPTPPSSDSRLQPLAETEDAGTPEFKPSESARPAFLASLSLAGSSSSSSNPRLKPSSFQPPSKPRSRPVPKAHAASRSSSRAPSIASSVNLNPAVKALLTSGSPSSKGPSTVSTTFTSMEKNPGSAHPSRSSSGGGDPDLQHYQPVVGLAQIIKPLSGGSPGTMSSVIELARRRLSFSSPSATTGPLGAGASGSQNSLGSSSGSALLINHSPHTPISRGIEGQAITDPSHSPSPRNSLNQPHQSTMLASPSSSGPTTGGGAGLTGSGFFGVWRRRKESTSTGIPPNSIPPPPSSSSITNTTATPSNPSNLQSVHSPSSASFVAASDLLKRFSAGSGTS